MPIARWQVWCRRRVHPPPTATVGAHRPASPAWPVSTNRLVEPKKDSCWRLSLLALREKTSQSHGLQVQAAIVLTVTSEGRRIELRCLLGAVTPEMVAAPDQCHRGTGSARPLVASPFRGKAPKATQGVVNAPASWPAGVRWTGCAAGTPEIRSPPARPRSP